MQRRASINSLNIHKLGQLPAQLFTNFPHFHHHLSPSSTPIFDVLGDLCVRIVP
jgi:hypothetical protein